MVFEVLNDVSLQAQHVWNGFTVRRVSYSVCTCSYGSLPGVWSRELPSTSGMASLFAVWCSFLTDGLSEALISASQNKGPNLWVCTLFESDSCYTRFICKAASSVWFGVYRCWEQLCMRVCWKLGALTLLTFSVFRNKLIRFYSYLKLDFQQVCPFGVPNMLQRH